jgi:hypothetical protein
MNGRQDWRNKILGLPDAEMEASEYERISLLKEEKFRKIYWRNKILDLPDGSFRKMMPRMMRQGMRKVLKMKPEMRMKYITLLVIMHKYIVKVRNTIASKMKK